MNKIFYFLFVLLLCGCGKKEKNNWLTPRNLGISEKIEIKNELIPEIDQASFIAQLEENEYIIINKELNTFTLAIRGVCSSQDGIFSTYINDDNSISVFSDNLGKPQNLKKVALIIKVNQLPNKVYVFCNNIL